MFVNRKVFEPRHSRFRALQHRMHLRRKYHNVRFQQVTLQFVRTILYTVITGLLISPLPDLLPDEFCLMVRIFRLMLVCYVYK
jgi:hypothetical protein